jgi:predicted HicB family RNase H-like nuclease
METIVIDAASEVKQQAEELFAQEPDWVMFYRKILGLRGAVRSRFPTRDTLAAFEQTEAHREIMRMLTHLRQHDAPASETGEPTRVITVRMPKSMHAALREEAHECRTSINKLCISKLLQFIDSQNVPAEL